MRRTADVSYALRLATSRVPLNLGMQDDDYLAILDKSVTAALDVCGDTLGLVIYNAGVLCVLSMFITGTDTLAADKLGQQQLSVDGIIRRDELVFTHCTRAHIPIVMITSGGYSSDSAVAIHKSIANLYARGLIVDP